MKEEYFVIKIADRDVTMYGIDAVSEIDAIQILCEFEANNSNAVHWYPGGYYYALPKWKAERELNIELPQDDNSQQLYTQ